MRYKFILIGTVIMLLACTTGSVWAQFYQSYNETERKGLAEAYYLAGAQYLKVGKTQLGKDYEALAFKIFPPLSPSSITEPVQPSAEELLQAGLAGRITAPQTAAPEIMPRSFFLRYIGALLDRDPAEVASFFDGSVYVEARGGEQNRDQIEEAYTNLFTNLPPVGVKPEQMYDLGSLTIVAGTSSMKAAWGETAILRVAAVADYSAELDFWDMQQQLFVRKLDSGWHIFAIGQNPPPLDFKPAALPAVAPIAPEVTPPPDQEIKDAFMSCVAAFLQKDVEGTLSHIDKELKILRVRQTVSGDELATTFQGYFDASDFGNAQVSDVIDESSMFVEPTQEFAGEVAGPVYTLNVKARLDMSDVIPFWTTYQRYYFVNDGGWKIFAVF
jgi:hypothetical protein